MPGRTMGRPSRGALLALLTGGPAWPLAATLPVWAQPAPQPVATQPGDQALTQAQLEQLLAPVALFPDTLLMQLLMAAA